MQYLRFIQLQTAISNHKMLFYWISPINAKSMDYSFLLFDLFSCLQFSLSMLSFCLTIAFFIYVCIFCILSSYLLSFLILNNLSFCDLLVSIKKQNSLINMQWRSVAQLWFQKMIKVENCFMSSFILFVQVNLNLLNYSFNIFSKVFKSYVFSTIQFKIQ